MDKIERENLTLLYVEHYPQLVNYAYYRINDKNLAEELVQEAFLKTIAYRRDARSKIIDLKNFIYRVLKNLIIDFYKQNRKLVISLDSISQKQILKSNKMEETMDRKLNYNLIVKSINKLDKRHKEILTYRYIEELNIETISNRTGLSPNYVSVIAYQAIKIIKKDVRDYMDG